MNFIESIPLLNAIIKGRFTILANILIYYAQLRTWSKKQTQLLYDICTVQLFYDMPLFDEALETSSVFNITC